MEKKYQVRLRAGHPTGFYRRAGYTFEAHVRTVFEAVPVVVEEAQLVDELRNDPYLEVVEIPNEAA
jgi:hypothetical protein